MIAIISDIHGNYPALKRVLAEIQIRGITRIISLGDIAGYYPFINECIDALKQRHTVNLMGNHDYYLVSKTGCPRSKSVNKLSAIQQKRITSKNLTWLGHSKVCFVKDDVSMVHGGWNNPLDEYIRQVSNQYFLPLPQRFFFSGHTHVQCLLKLKSGQVYCNPGSVGQPRDGNPKASFALFDGKKIELCRISYNINIVVDELKKYGFSEYYTCGLYKGCRIGGKFDGIKYIED